MRKTQSRRATPKVPVWNGSNSSTKKEETKKLKSPIRSSSKKVDDVIPADKLDFWIKIKANVLLIGKHGVGKTESIKEAFKRNGIRYAYFSCASLDPFTDLVGIPQKFTDENGITYLDFLRPKIFAYDEIDAIFFDELNRAKPKVRNSLMELLQFGSINGHKLKNLKFIWGAVNPPQEEDKSDTNIHYDVEELDSAQISRFQVKYNVPFILSKSFLDRVHGKGIYEKINPWWEKLPMKIRNEFPPRNVSYTLWMLKKGGDISDTLPDSIPKSAFLKALKEGDKRPDVKGLKSIVSDLSPENFISDPSIKKLTKSKLVKFISALNNEQLTKFFITNCLSKRGTPKKLNAFGYKLYTEKFLRQSQVTALRKNSDCYKALEKSIPVIYTGKAFNWSQVLASVFKDKLLDKGFTSKEVGQLSRGTFTLKDLVDRMSLKDDFSKAASLEASESEGKEDDGDYDDSDYSMSI